MLLITEIRISRISVISRVTKMQLPAAYIGNNHFNIIPFFIFGGPAVMCHH